MTYLRVRGPGRWNFAGIVAIALIALCGCAADEPGPSIKRTVALGPISDQTNTGFYTVDSGVLVQDEFGVTLTLGFTIENSNGIDFDPITTVDFDGGDTLTCKADDLRRIPSLVATTA